VPELQVAPDDPRLRDAERRGGCADSTNKAFLPLIVLLWSASSLCVGVLCPAMEVALKLRWARSCRPTTTGPALPGAGSQRHSQVRQPIQTSTPDRRFLTVEKKDVLVDSYVKWRIANVASIPGDGRWQRRAAERLLGERINTRLRDEFGKRTIQEVVSGERGEIMSLLTKTPTSAPRSWASRSSTCG